MRGYKDYIYSLLLLQDVSWEYLYSSYTFYIKSISSDFTLVNCLLFNPFLSSSCPIAQWTFPQKTPSIPTSEGVTLTGDTGKHLECHHHDMYCHISLGAAAPAFCVNSRRFVFKAEMLRSVWIIIGGGLANLGCSIYASSLVWMGLLCLSGLPLAEAVSMPR